MRGICAFELVSVSRFVGGVEASYGIVRVKGKFCSDSRISNGSGVDAFVNDVGGCRI